MVERIHELGSRSRRELLDDLACRFGPVDHLDKSLLKRFRRAAAGEIRYDAAGETWTSLRS